MEKFNKVMWVIYWAMFIVGTVGMALYCAVEKVRNWINRHIVVPYVRGCEKVAEQINDMYYGYDESESEEE